MNLFFEANINAIKVWKVNKKILQRFKICLHWKMWSSKKILENIFLLSTKTKYFQVFNKDLKCSYREKFIDHALKQCLNLLGHQLRNTFNMKIVGQILNKYLKRTISAMFNFIYLSSELGTFNILLKEVSCCKKGNSNFYWKHSHEKNLRFLPFYRNPMRVTWYFLIKYFPAKKLQKLCNFMIELKS